MSIWLIFIISAGIVFISGIKLPRYGEALAVKTKLGGLWVGSVILAAATSMPELVASISSGWLGNPDISLGNLFGSNIFNIIIIAVMDAIDRKTLVLQKASPGHVIAAVFSMLLSTIASVFIMLRIDLTILGLGIDSLILAMVYVLALRIIGRYEKRPSGEKIIILADGLPAPEKEKSPEEQQKEITLKRAVTGFIIISILIAAAGYYLSYSAAKIAEMTGIGATFVGSILVAFVTSAPELVASIASVRMGAIDMAVGNVLGSNIFNMFIIFLADMAYRPGPILAHASSTHVLTSLLGLVLACVVILGLTYRSKRNLKGLSIDSLFIIVIYLLATYILFLKG